jgi:HD-GYP domain-containing protein (c-di-GMP phosphodiesterase class II)
MPAPLILLADPDSARRTLLAGAMKRSHADVVEAWTLAAASRAGAISPQLVALAVEPWAEDALALVKRWRDDADRRAIPLLAIVPADAAGSAVAEMAENALLAGADDVLPWPASDAFVRARIRGLTRGAMLGAEVAEYGRVLEEIVRTIEAREPHSIDHSLRVAELAAEVGKAVGLARDEIEIIRRASLILDIGAIALPDSLHYKAAPLDLDELALIRSHPVVGAELLRGIPALEPLRPFIHRHHERIDGSGYPDGLAGSDLSLSVQVVGIADAYDAIRSSRPHRPGPSSHEEAMGILEGQARGGSWDPNLVAALQTAATSLDLV